VNKITELLINHSSQYFDSHDVPEWTKECVARIIACAKHELGQSVHICINCGQLFTANNTCHTKNCPTCGFYQTYDWLLKNDATFPDVPYQHIVFTLPLFIRPFFSTNFKPLVDLQFASASAALTRFAATKKTQIFWFAAFQFCGEIMNRHPHLHFLVPCTGLSFDGQSLKDFCYYHAKTLSYNYTKTFIKKLLRLAKKGLLVLPPEYAHLDSPDKLCKFILDSVAANEKLREKNVPSDNLDFIKSVCPDISNPSFRYWCVYCAQVRKEDAPFGYIVRYLHHPPITQAKIVSLNRRVSCRFKNPVTGFKQYFHFSYDEFLDRFLDQFFPKGFHAVRRGGLLASCHKAKMQKLRELVAERNKASHKLILPNPLSSQMFAYKIKKARQKKRTCSCGGTKRFFKNFCHNHWVFQFLAALNININDLRYSELLALPDFNKPAFDSS